MALTDIAIRNARVKDKPYKLSDTAGLYLLINTNGKKYWRLKYRFSGKEKLLSIGVYPVINLSEARDKSLDAKKLLANNIDPSQLKKEKRIKQLLDSEHSFEKIASEWHNNQKSRWTEKYAISVYKKLQADIFPIIGSRPINEIKAPELLTALRLIEARGSIDIAHRVLQICGQIFRYAIATGKAERDISADLRGALKTRKSKNYSCLKANELPEFLDKLQKYDGDLQTKLALTLLILTFTRTGEIRGAKWSEIDFEKKEWCIAAERMKMRELHTVPLSQQTIDILKQLHLINGDRDYLFPNRNKPMSFISENTLLYAIYRMGYHSRTTVHGFRATASTILNEHGFKPDVIERQLAHAERNKVRASYNHAEYMPERREMMGWWGNYLDEIR